jgi:hypothetical protein
VSSLHQRPELWPLCRANKWHRKGIWGMCAQTVTADAAGVSTVTGTPPPGAVWNAKTRFWECATNGWQYMYANAWLAGSSTYGPATDNWAGSNQFTRPACLTLHCPRIVSDLYPKASDLVLNSALFGSLQWMKDHGAAELGASVRGNAPHALS